MDIYFRGFDSDSPITSATKHLSSFAVRLLLSMLRSIKHLDDAAFDALMKVVSIDNLWALCIILGGWMLSALIGGPVGAAVSAILLYLGVREFYERIAEIYTPLKDWLSTAYNAKDDKDLEKASEHFAVGLANGAITVIEFVVLHKLFKATESQLFKRFPPPDWLRTTWDRTVGERLRRRPTKSAAEKAAAEKDQAGGAVPVLAGALQTQGARRAAGSASFPVGSVVAISAAVALALGLTIVAATTTEEKR